MTWPRGPGWDGRYLRSGSCKTSATDALLEAASVASATIASERS